MRRLFGWLGAAFGGIALYRLLTRRAPAGVEEPREAPGVETRAEELRRRLDESRALVEERETFEEGETAVDQADPDTPPEERRRQVHERGREAAERMKPPPPE